MQHGGRAVGITGGIAAARQEFVPNDRAQALETEGPLDGTAGGTFTPILPSATTCIAADLPVSPIDRKTPYETMVLGPVEGGHDMDARAAWFALAAMNAWLLAGCGSESASRSELIGTAGGMVEHEGVSLEIPAGALAEDVEISISTSAGAAPDGYAPRSPVYVFAPDGLQFAVPAEVSIAFDGDPDPQIQWSLRDGDGFEPLATQRSGMLARGAVTHFSRGFVGDIAADGPDAATQAPDAAGGSCGSNPACAAGQMCVAGQCVSCGHSQEPCCPGNICVQGSCVVLDGGASGICLFGG